MRWFFAAFLIVSASSARSDTITPPSGLEHFKLTVGGIGKRSVITAEWLYSLSYIEDKCSMKVDRGHLQLLENTFNDMSDVEIALRHMPVTLIDEYRRDLDAIDEKDPTAVCRIANALWGEDGDQYPGVFKMRKK